MKMGRARAVIAWVWLVLGMGTFVLVATQSLFARYEPRTRDVWDWLLPSLMPTLMLVAGAIAATRRPGSHDEQAPKALVFWAIGLSSLYLLFVASPFVLPAFIGQAPFTLIDRITLFIGPFQGLVSAIVGVFFVHVARNATP